MAIFQKFVNAIRINDDDDLEDEEMYDEEDDLDEDYEDKPKKGFFGKFFNRDKDDDYDDDEDDEDDYREAPKKAEKAKAKAAPEAAAPAPSPFTAKPKVTPIKRRNSGSMAVSVIKPSSMEDTKEIVDTILSGCTVLLNLEGINVDLAQRIIDFGCGASYAINGSLRKVSAYIFILTPANVDVTGDITDILSSSIPSVGSTY